VALSVPSGRQNPALAILDQEISQLQRMGLQLKLGVEFGTVVTLDGLQRGFDVVLLATGELAKGESLGFGLAMTSTGLKVDPENWQTSVPNVFAAGSAVKPVKQVVRAMAEGRAAAESIDRLLCGQPAGRPEKSFSSTMGRLEKAEIELFLKSANSISRQTLRVMVVPGSIVRKRPPKLRAACIATAGQSGTANSSITLNSTALIQAVSANNAGLSSSNWIEVTSSSNRQMYPLRYLRALDRAGA